MAQVKLEPRPKRSLLFLMIDRTAYTVRPIEAGEDRAFRLAKADGTLYDVAQTRHGHQCDCPDFIFRRDGIDPRGCKHVQALVAEGLLRAEPEPRLRPSQRRPLLVAR
jgi:hypothetical protein